MISQIRIYTINKGEMDNFLKHFKEDIVGLHQKIGVPIAGTWVNRPQNEFIWVRTHNGHRWGQVFTLDIRCIVF
jgi:hypothetical protein